MVEDKEYKSGKQKQLEKRRTLKPKKTKHNRNQKTLENYGNKKK